MRYNELSKYGNIKTHTQHGTFDSRKEAKRYDELMFLQRNGDISDVQRQVKFEIIPKTDKSRASHYIADFTYKLPNGQTIIEDVKGYRGGAAYTIFRLKQKLVYTRYAIWITEI